MDDDDNQDQNRVHVVSRQNGISLSHIAKDYMTAIGVGYSDVSAYVKRYSRDIVHRGIGSSRKVSITTTNLLNLFRSITLLDSISWNNLIVALKILDVRKIQLKITFYRGDDLSPTTIKHEVTLTPETTKENDSWK